MKTTNKFKYRLTGRVVRGKQYGRVLGFPTANIDSRDCVRQKLSIKLGIYAGRVVIGQGLKIKDKGYLSAIVIGPIDKTGLPKIEAHLLNFKGNLYGRKITVQLEQYIRPFRDYTTVEALKSQIQKDINTIIAYEKSQAGSLR